MAWFRCFQCPDPRPHRAGKFKEFEGDRPSCPHCGAGEPAVVRLIDVHLLIEDAKGPLYGQAGKRFRVGCQPKRDVLARHVHDVFAATPDVRAVTCRPCQGTEAFRSQARAFEELFHVLEDLAAPKED